MIACEVSHMTLNTHNLLDSLTSGLTKTKRQGCCLMGARMPEALTICLQATTIFNKEPALVPKTYDFYGNGLYTYFQ